MYYIVTEYYGTSRQLFGWTENPYIIKMIMSDPFDDRPLSIMEYDVEIEEFLNILEDDFRVFHTASKYELKVMTSKTGVRCISAYKWFDLAMEDEFGTIHDHISELLYSVLRLMMLSDYCKIPEFNNFILYFVKAHLIGILRTYGTDMLNNMEIDILGLLIQKGTFEKI